MLTQSIALNVVLGFLLIILIAIDKEDIKAKLKVKLSRGSSYAIFVGLDRNIRIKAIKTSGKKDKLDEFEDGGYKYKLIPEMIAFRNKVPTWLYIEGKVDPINPTALLSMEGLDGEWLAKVIDKAFIAGKLPESQTNKKYELIWLVGAGASVVSLLILLNLAGFV